LNVLATAGRESSSLVFDSQQREVGSRVPALDGLRGIAILAVLLFHYAGGALHQSHSAIVGAISMAIGFGWTGVDLFFVLSGFLITGILYDTRGAPNYYKNFYARRALRIVPAYYLLMTIYVLLTAFLHLHWKPAHLFFLIYLGYPAILIWPYLESISSFVVVGHLWSLCAEEQFYLVWPWTIATLKNRKSILAACGALGALAILLRMAILASGRLDPAWAYGFLPCRIDALALGAALAVLARSPACMHLQRWAPVATVAASSILMCIVAIRHTTGRYDFVIATIGYSIIAVAYGGLLVLSLRKGGLLEYVLSSRALRVFGKYSYGLYLYHLPLAAVLHPMKDYFIAGTRSFLMGSAVYLISALALNLVVAGLSFHFFESPILRLKAHFQY
jgi:peptidoglycan/LPS O-acetylase OafA/YrhL